MFYHASHETYSIVFNKGCLPPCRKNLLWVQMSLQCVYILGPFMSTPLQHRLIEETSHLQHIIDHLIFLLVSIMQLTSMDRRNGIQRDGLLEGEISLKEVTLSLHRSSLNMLAYNADVNPKSYKVVINTLNVSHPYRVYT